MQNFKKLKLNLIMEKLAQIFAIIKYQNKAPNVCLSVILTDSVHRKDKNYYPQLFLEECKYVEKKTSKFITDDTEIFSVDSDKEDFDEENFDEES